MTRLIIFCHGSGDTGAGAEAWVSAVADPLLRERFEWAFPTAKRIRYSLGGSEASVWFDRKGGFEPTFPEQTASVIASVGRLELIINEYERRGVTRDRIALAGFSMGGGIALQAAARLEIAAVAAISSYLCDDSPAYDLEFPPVFMAHGAADEFISARWGEMTARRIEATGGRVRFRLYETVAHELAPAPLNDALAFLDDIIPRVS